MQSFLSRAGVGWQKLSMLGAPGQGDAPVAISFELRKRVRFSQPAEVFLL